MAQTRSVVFLYRRAQEFRGSKTMRCDQLAEIGGAYLGDRYAFSVQRLPPPRNEARQLRLAKALEGHILIFLKSAFRALTPAALDAFRARAAGLCLDYVDASISEMPDFPIDMHISASLAGKAALETALAKAQDARSHAVVRLLHHHADRRVVWSDMSNDQSLSACYVGEAGNVFIPDAVRSEVEVIDTATVGFGPEAIALLSASNLHYAIRAPKRRRQVTMFKPFTKGFNAAAAGANIFVRRSEDDAAAILGDDYPFFCDAETDDGIRDDLLRVQAAVGGPEWRDGLDRMAYARSVSSADAIAKGLSDLLSHFG